jgi:purine-binding chemotaxis protein CheW
MSPTLMATFTVGELLLGVDVDVVQEVIGRQDITNVPLAAYAATGLINLRGEVVTAIDMRARFELAPRPADVAAMNVVVRVAGELVSLLVDAIGDVVEVIETQFEDLPETVTGVGRELVRGAYKRTDGLLLALDVARAVGHQQLHEQPA